MGVAGSNLAIHTMRLLPETTSTHPRRRTKGGQRGAQAAALEMTSGSGDGEFSRCMPQSVSVSLTLRRSFRYCPYLPVLPLSHRYVKTRSHPTIPNSTTHLYSLSQAATSLPLLLKDIGWADAEMGDSDRDKTWHIDSMARHLRTRHFRRRAAFWCPYDDCTAILADAGHFADHARRHRGLQLPPAVLSR